MPLLAGWTQTGTKLTNADGVGILGAVYFALCGQVCESFSDMHANNAAQGMILKLRHEQWRKTYGRKF
jgi:hypothetical protein